MSAATGSHTQGDRSRLDQLIGALQSGSGADPETGMRVAEAAHAWREPPRIQVAGCSGTGRSTVLHALALLSAVETAPVDAPDSPDPVLDGDIVVYVVSGQPTPADRRVLAGLPHERTVLVLNKADAVGGSWAEAVAAAQQYGRELGVAALPVVASLATRTRAGAIADPDLATLRWVAANENESVTLAAEIFVGPDRATDRVRALERWDLYGVACATTALRHDPELSAQLLLQIMHAASGIDALHNLLQHRYAQVGARRGGVLLDELQRLAAAAIPAGGAAAGLIEEFLHSDDALWMGLLAGLACPDVTHLAAAYPRPAPGDADEALERATRWRSVVSSDMPPAARRAALRVHHGYIRYWERMTGARG